MRGAGRGDLLRRGTRQRPERAVPAPGRTCYPAGPCRVTTLRATGRAADQVEVVAAIDDAGPVAVAEDLLDPDDARALSGAGSRAAGPRRRSREEARAVSGHAIAPAAPGSRRPPTWRGCRGAGGRTRPRPAARRPRPAAALPRRGRRDRDDGGHRARHRQRPAAGSGSSRPSRSAPCAGRSRRSAARPDDRGPTPSARSRRRISSWSSPLEPTNDSASIRRSPSTSVTRPPASSMTTCGAARSHGVHAGLDHRLGGALGDAARSPRSRRSRGPATRRRSARRSPACRPARDVLAAAAVDQLRVLDRAPPRETRIRPPRRPGRRFHAPPPRHAHQRSRIAGAEITPTWSSPSCSTAEQRPEQRHAADEVVGAVDGVDVPAGRRASPSSVAVLLADQAVVRATRPGMPAADLALDRPGRRPSRTTDRACARGRGRGGSARARSRRRRRRRRARSASHSRSCRLGRAGERRRTTPVRTARRRVTGADDALLTTGSARRPGRTAAPAPPRSRPTSRTRRPRPALPIGDVGRQVGVGDATARR